MNKEDIALGQDDIAACSEFGEDIYGTCLSVGIE
jgi:hypothetical protein